ncbi:MAG: hypothetical protein JWO19_1385 [Bryobacterales bacterium]|nr:hypothetical protein [Bryobacterales bacterium]
MLRLTVEGDTLWSLDSMVDLVRFHVGTRDIRRPSAACRNCGQRRGGVLHAKKTRLLDLEETDSYKIDYARFSYS